MAGAQISRGQSRIAVGNSERQSIRLEEAYTKQISVPSSHNWRLEGDYSVSDRDEARQRNEELLAPLMSTNISLSINY